jgi:hypothetical protein
MQDLSTKHIFAKLQLVRLSLFQQVRADERKAYLVDKEKKQPFFPAEKTENWRNTEIRPLSTTTISRQEKQTQVYLVQTEN